MVKKIITMRLKKNILIMFKNRSEQIITKSARLLVMNGAKNVLAKTKACAVSNVLSMKRLIILKHLVCAAALSVSTEKLKRSASVKKSMTIRPFCM